MKGALDSPLKVLGFVAVVMLTVQGLMMLHSLARRAPGPARGEERPAVTARTADRRVRPAVGLPFLPGKRPPRAEVLEPVRPAVGTARSAGASSGDPYVSGSSRRTLDEVVGRVREFFASHGIDDGDLVWMCALEEADRAYQEVLARAQGLRRDGKPRQAIELIQEALAGLDSRHIIARSRLLGALTDTSLEASDLTLAASTRGELRAIRDKVSDILGRAAAGKEGADPAASEKIKQSEKASEEMDRRLYELAKSMGGEGDLSRFPEVLDKLGEQLAGRR